MEAILKFSAFTTNKPTPNEDSNEAANIMQGTHTATFGAGKTHAAGLPSDPYGAWRTRAAIFPRSTLEN